MFTDINIVLLTDVRTIFQQNAAYYFFAIFRFAESPVPEEDLEDPSLGDLIQQAQVMLGMLTSTDRAIISERYSGNLWRGDLEQALEEMEVMLRAY